MSENNQTTAEHFEIFKAEVKHHVREFGLLDWAVCIRHEDNLPGSLGECEVLIINKTAIIRLAVDWSGAELTNDEIKKVAYHEVCELLLADLGQVWQWHMGTEDEKKQLVAKFKHDVIRRLENRYFGE